MKLSISQQPLYPKLIQSYPFQGGTILGTPDSIEDMGITQVPYEMFHSYLGQLAANNFRYLLHSCC